MALNLMISGAPKPLANCWIGSDQVRSPLVAANSGTVADNPGAAVRIGSPDCPVQRYVIAQTAGSRCLIAYTADELFLTMRGSTNFRLPFDA